MADNTLVIDDDDASPFWKPNAIKERTAVVLAGNQHVM